MSTIFLWLWFKSLWPVLQGRGRLASSYCKDPETDAQGLKCEWEKLVWYMPTLPVAPGGLQGESSKERPQGGPLSVLGRARDQPHVKEPS